MRLIDADAFEVFTYTHRNNDFDHGVQYVLEAIDNAPTIEPDVPDINDGDMISRQAAIDMIRLYREDEVVDLDELESSIAMMPSTQPELIHCRHCKWHNGEINQCSVQICASMRGEDFCSRAERRTDE